MASPLNVVVADDDRASREALRELLSRLGHRVATADSGGHLVEVCRASPPDLVIGDVRMPGLDGIEAAAEVNRGRDTPVILMSAYDEDGLLTRAGAEHAVMAYLVKPVRAADVKAAIALALARFEQFRAIRRETAGLRQALEDRKVIERAKGILMKRLRVDEEDAYRRLRKLSGDRNRKLVEVAGEVVDADEVFRRLDGV